MTEKPKRLWWKLHALTWFVGVVSFVALLGANIDDRVETGANTAYVRFGWPAQYANGHSGNRQFILRWWDAMAGKISKRRLLLAGLAFDVIFGLVIAVSAIWLAERWCRRWSIVFRFHLKSILAFTAWSACSLTAVRQWHHHLERLDLLSDASMGAFCSVMLIAWIALFDMLCIAWSKIAGREKP